MRRVPISLQKLKEVKSLAQEHIVGKRRNWDLNPSDSDSRACALSALPSDGLQMVLEWPRVRLACCPPPEDIIPMVVYVLGLPGIVQCVHMATCREAHALLSTTTKSLNTIAARESIQQQFS